MVRSDEVIVMKKLLTVGIALFGMASLMTGCGNGKQSHPKVVTETHKREANRWSKKKDQTLSRFMKEWGRKRGQKYTKYDGHHDIKTALGMKFPTALKYATVNGNRPKIGWSPNGKAIKGYNVVALYNYDLPKGTDCITYAFTLKNGEPIVLSNEGQSNNWVPAADENLQDNFANVIEDRPTKLKKVEKAEEATSKVESSSAKSESSSAKSDDAHDDDRDGYVITPKAMRGTWYAKTEYGSYRLVVTDHQITEISSDGDEDNTILYRRKRPTPEPGSYSEEEVERAKNWADATNRQLEGKDTIIIRGWFQNDGSNRYYSYHTEEIDGKKVPIIINMDNSAGLVDTIFYPSEDMANQQETARYDDLRYRDDE
ncbi:hypothetical protein FC54_GL000602 [Ligilactobacillus saerimneri DSM 16049]|nr:hypothetical protein FC54_GL000602 [Ligilactobacillus saerimneri DSM 16049]